MPAPTCPIVRQHYLDLPDGLYTRSAPAAAAAPEWLALNDRLLGQLGIAPDWFHSPAALAVLSGSAPAGPEALAMAYAGHQFGGWVPSLGDGRAHLLGQMLDSNNQPLDVQLKGSGRTPWSRGGDGLATVQAVLREYLVSEAMAGLGIPTTGALAAIATGGTVLREGPEPGAILVRTARSHIRVGSFQYAAAHLGDDGVQALVEHLVAHHFPAAAAADNPALALFGAIAERQARLIAQWMLVGFIHGVMNTDNMAVAGETIDYGPCAFVDVFHPQKVFSSIDDLGRYAWGNQPGIGQWNLARLGSCLVPLLDADAERAQALAATVLEDFAAQFHSAFDAGMRAKLGLAGKLDQASSKAFGETTLGLLAQHEIDFTCFFDRLTTVAGGETDSWLLDLFVDRDAAQAWLTEWRAVHEASADSVARMRTANPALIARNHRVAEALAAASTDGFLAPFQRLCRALANPWQVADADRDLQQPPAPQEVVTRTYCGT